MNTIKIYLAESGRVASLSKDFPLYQGQYQNKLLNVYVPTSILEPELNTTQHYIGATSGSNYPNATILNDFVSSQIIRPSGEASPQKYDRVDYTQTTTPNNILCQCIFNGSSWRITEVDEFAPPYFANANNVSIGCVSVSRDGTQYKSIERAMRYVKTLTYNNVEYALYERKLPKEITNFSGVGVNAPTLVINVINYDLSSKTVIDIITSQECSLDVMPSTILDKDEPVEASELQILQANVSSLNTSSGQQANAITNLRNRMATAEDTITSHGTRITTLENTVASGETFIGTMTITSATLPTNQELDAFVLQEEERQAKGGDSVIVIQQIVGATDKNYKYIRNATTWTHYEIPAMEKADNGSLGIVKGTYGTGSTNDIQVDITDGQIKEIYADNGTKLSDTIEYANDIKDGTKVVEKSNKAQYDFNGVQLLNVNNGASKTYVRDYALPKEFNQAHYLQSDGLTFGLTQPTSGNISVSVPASIGYTTLFDATYTLPDNMKFQIANKNGYASSFKLSSSAVKGGKFVLTTKISTDSGATFISADVLTSDEISFGLGEIKELKFENKFDDLTDVYVLETGDKIEQKLELLSESSVATTITLYTSTYPSRMYLNTMSYAIITSSGLLGEITDLQGVATIGENITIKVDDATNLNDKCLYELSFSANLTGNLGKNIYLTRDNVESIAINSYLGTGKASDLVMYEIGNTQAYKLLLYYKDNAFYMQNYNIEKLVEGSTYINVELNATDSKLVVELDETNIETEKAREDSGKLITSGAVFDDLAEIKSELESTNLTDTNNSITRTTGGSLAIKDGQELVKQVSGQSYVWNQLVQISTATSSTSNGITYTNNNDGSWTINGTATDDSYKSILSTYVSANANHKYIITGCPSGGSSSTYYTYFTSKLTAYDYGNGVIRDCQEYGDCGYVIYIKNGTTVNNLRVVPQLFDITSTPTITIAQFKVLFPNTYYPYSAPTLVSSNNEYKNSNADSTKSALLSYNGTLERKVGMKIYDGSSDENWQVETLGQFSENNFYISIDNAQKLKLIPLSNQFVSYAVGSAGLIQGKANGFISSSGNFNFYPGELVQGVQALRTKLQNNPLVILYELATPTTETIVNATNVELRGVGTAKDTLSNESGLACWKDGTTTQVNKNGIVAIPYSVSEEFAVSINGQLQHNLEVDKAQQSEIQDLENKINQPYMGDVYTDDIMSESLVGGTGVELASFSTQDNHWHLANTKVDDSLSIESDLIVSGIENITNGTSPLFWHGTQAQYDALGTYNSDTLYIIVG